MKKSQAPNSPRTSQNQSREHKQMYEIFASFDRDGSGTISIQQWREVMKRFGHDASSEQIFQILDQHQIVNKNQITLLQFIEIIRKKQLDLRGWEHEELVNAFRLFDKDLDGTLTAVQLKAGLERAGQHMALQDLQMLVVMADKDKNGSINFQEFCKIMTLK